MSIPSLLSKLKPLTVSTLLALGFPLAAFADDKNESTSSGSTVNVSASAKNNNSTSVFTNFTQAEINSVRALFLQNEASLTIQQPRLYQKIVGHTSKSDYVQVKFTPAEITFLKTFLNQHNQPALSQKLLYIDSTSVQGINAFYDPQVIASGFYGNNGTSYSSLDFWIPVWQRADRVAFIDVNGVKGENVLWTGSVGGGYRWLSPAEQFLYGVYAFYGTYNSANFNNLYQQATFGAEIKTDHWSLGGNYYLPLGKTQYYENSLDTFQVTGSQLAETLWVGNGFETTSTGFDIELGRTVPYFDPLRLYAAYYYFTPSNSGTVGTNVISGSRFSLDFRLDQAFDWNLAWLERASVEGSWQYDGVQGTLWTAGLKLNIPFGKKSDNSSMSLLQQQMTADIRRSLNSVTTQDADAISPFQLNGHTAVISKVTTGDQLVQYAGNTSNSDVVAITQDVTTNTQVLLHNGVVVTGHYLEYKPGAFFNITGNTANAKVAQVGSAAPIFVISANNTLRDMTVVSAETGFTTFASAISLTAGIGTFKIDDVTTNGQVLVSLGSASTSNVIIENSNFNMGDKTDPAISITASTGAIINTTIDNKNTINFTNNSFTAPTRQIGIDLFEADSQSQIVINSISENQINFNNTTGSTGISFVSNFSPTATNPRIQGGDISNNTINFTGASDQDTNTGILVTSNAGDLSLGGISANTINVGSTYNLANAVGIAITSNSSGTQLINNVSSNTITMDAGGAGPGIEGSNKGIYFLNTLSGTQQTYGVSNNTISFKAGDNNTGISFYNGTQGNLAQQQSGQQLIGAVTNNFFSFPTASTLNASAAIAVQVGQGRLADLYAHSTTFNEFYGNGYDVGGKNIDAGFVLQAYDYSKINIKIGNGAPPESSLAILSAMNGGISVPTTYPNGLLANPYHGLLRLGIIQIENLTV